MLLRNEKFLNIISAEEKQDIALINDSTVFILTNPKIRNATGGESITNLSKASKLIHIIEKSVSQGISKASESMLNSNIIENGLGQTSQMIAVYDSNTTPLSIKSGYTYLDSVDQSEISKMSHENNDSSYNSYVTSGPNNNNVSSSRCSIILNGSIASGSNKIGSNENSEYKSYGAALGGGILINNNQTYGSLMSVWQSGSVQSEEKDLWKYKNQFSLVGARICLKHEFDNSMFFGFWRNVRKNQ